MQYIQLQPQIAANVPVAPSGSVNYYIDINDKLIKTKDADGITHSAVPFISVTKSQIDNLINASQLLVGQFYMITDAGSSLYGGTEIILQATSINTLSKRGWGLFYNPKYVDPNNVVAGRYTVWSNQSLTYIYNTTGFFQVGEGIIGDDGQSGYLVTMPGNNTLSFVETGGDWSTSQHIYGQNSEASTLTDGFIHKAIYNVNDKVIWGNKVWINLTGAVGNYGEGDQTTLDGTNWLFVNYNTTDYDYVSDIIEYEYEFDNISYRKDETNEVTANYIVWSNAWNFNNIRGFPWGNKVVRNVSIKNSYINALVNFPNQTFIRPNLMEYVNVGEYAEFDVYNWGWGTRIKNLTVENEASFGPVTFGNNGQIYSIKVHEDAYIGNITFGNNDSGNNQMYFVELGKATAIVNVQMYDGSYMENIILDSFSSIETIVLYANSYLYDIKLNFESSITNINLATSAFLWRIYCGIGSGINNLQFDVNTNFERIELGNGSQITNFTVNGSSNQISNIKIGIGSTITSITLNGGNNFINSLELGNNVTLQNITMNGSAEYTNHRYADTANINLLTLATNAILEYLDMGVNSSFQSSSIDNSITVSNMEIGLSSSLVNLNFPVNTNNQIINLNNSTFSVILDITNSNVVDLTSYPHVGFITLSSSNGTELITEIINSSQTFNQTFKAITGITVTFSGSPASSISSNNLLVMPTSTFSVNGSTYDYIIFKSDTNNAFSFAKQIDGKNYL